MALLSLTSCTEKKKDSYAKQNIEIMEIGSSFEKSENKEEIQINGVYDLKRQANLYSDKNEDSVFDKLDKDSSIKVLLEEEDGYVFIENNGNKAFIKAEDIDIKWSRKCEIIFFEIFLKKACIIKNRCYNNIVLRQ